MWTSKYPHRNGLRAQEIVTVHMQLGTHL